VLSITHRLEEFMRNVRKLVAITGLGPEFSETRPGVQRIWLNPTTGQELDALAKEVVPRPNDVVERMKKLMGR
jgi:hypothetical protein